MKTNNLDPNYNDINFDVDFANYNPMDVETDETINAVFVVDASYSIKSYVKQLNAAFNDFVQSMQKSHVADRLFVSIVAFHSQVKVLTGFQPIASIQKMDFAKHIGGATALYDACLVGLHNALDYRQNLENSGVDTKTLFFVITDGEDNSSNNNPTLVKNKMLEIQQDEHSAFSFTSILFGVGNQANFSQAQQQMGIQHLAQVGTTGDDMKKMIGFISQSISSTAAGQNIPTF